MKKRFDRDTRVENWLGSLENAVESGVEALDEPGAVKPEWLKILRTQVEAISAAEKRLAKRLNAPKGIHGRPDGWPVAAK